MFAPSHTVRTQDALHTYNDPANAPEVDQPGLEAQQPGPEVYYHQVLPAEQEKWSTPQQRQWGIKNEKDSRRICGLRVVTFWLLIALVSVIVVAAAVGGGVGGAEASKNNSGGGSGKNVANTQSEHASIAPGTVTVAAATVTITHLDAGSTSSASATPVSTCQEESSTNYVGSGSHLAYKKVCNSNLSSGSTRQTVFASPTRTFDECIGMCDSYNYFMNTKNVTVINWNWSGQGQQALGMCWCSQATGYQMSISTGEDSACLVGTFTSSDLPGG